MTVARADRPPVVNSLVACDHRQMVGRLVGREAELDRIAGAVVSARGGTSRCLLVTGEAGIGKSRLVAEAVGSLDDALVLTGHAADMTTGEIPFGVVADTLRDLARVAGVDVLLPAEREALAPLLPGAAPRQQVERVQLLSTFLDLLERLAGERLVVWVVEDLHWADSATRDLVGLAARTLPAGLLIVATVRTDDPERTPAAEAALTSYVAGLARTPGCEVLPLSRLGTDAVQRQLRDLLGSHPSAEVASRVERLSDGIPFVVEELVAAAGRPELTTVAAVAAGRLGSLGPETRRLVEAAAVGDGPPADQPAGAGPRRHARGARRGAGRGAARRDPHDRPRARRGGLPARAPARGGGPRDRTGCAAGVAPPVGRGAGGQPGRAPADPALLAIAEHWHQAKDTRRALAATVAAMPAAGRICRADEELALWARVMRGYGTLHDAAQRGGPQPPRGLRPVGAHGGCRVPRRRAGVDRRRAHRAAHRAGPQVPSRCARSSTGRARPTPMPTTSCSPSPRPSTRRRTICSPSWCGRSPAATSPSTPSAAMSSSPAPGPTPVGSATPGSPSWSPRSSPTGPRCSATPKGAATRLREVLEEIGDTTWLGVFHLWGNLAWCEVVCGNHRPCGRGGDRRAVAAPPPAPVDQCLGAPGRERQPPPGS